MISTRAVAVQGLGGSTRLAALQGLVALASESSIQIRLPAPVDMRLRILQEDELLLTVVMASIHLLSKS